MMHRLAGKQNFLTSVPKRSFGTRNTSDRPTRTANTHRPNLHRQSPLAPLQSLSMDWTSLRNEMPVTRHWAFLDHAAVAPLTEPAHKALAEWAGDMAENGVLHEPLWLKRVED